MPALEPVKSSTIKYVSTRGKCSKLKHSVNIHYYYFQLYIPDEQRYSCVYISKLQKHDGCDILFHKYFDLVKHSQIKRRGAENQR